MQIMQCNAMQRNATQCNAMHVVVCTRIYWHVLACATNIYKLVCVIWIHVVNSGCFWHVSYVCLLHSAEIRRLLCSGYTWTLQHSTFLRAQRIARNLHLVTIHLTHHDTSLKSAELQSPLPRSPWVNARQVRNHWRYALIHAHTCKPGGAVLSIT